MFRITYISPNDLGKFYQLTDNLFEMLQVLEDLGWTIVEVI